MELIREADRFKWMAHSNHSIKRFTKDDIDRMTNDYRTCLGRGGFGEVYEGVLEDGSMVAVKRFIRGVIRDVKENFAKELIVHREINHKNVVRLIGCCEEENALMLVTEYVVNGNLSDVLHHDNHPIPLDLRLRIAMECAEALAYMHSHMYTQVIHGDIKPDNILLDSNFHAKLSDFGISRLTNTDKTLHTKKVIGSTDYMDPLFRLDGCLTVKYDVYSFGVVLLELLTRKKPATVIDNGNIVYAFTSALARGVRGARWMFDAEIASKDNMKIVEGVAKIAGECLIMERDKRPKMIDVAERLRGLKKASHQDYGQQRAGLFSWVRKSQSAAPSAALTTPANISLSDKLRKSSSAKSQTAAPSVALLTTANISPSDKLRKFSPAKSQPAAPSTALLTPANISPSDKLREFSPAEIKAATDNLSSLRVHGNVACLVNIDGADTKVSVNRLYGNKCHFHSLIEAVSKLRHDHLVPLIGYCRHEYRIFLVYEYMAHGSLRKHLYGTQNPPLSWKQRMEICIGVASGLRYLHELNITHDAMNTERILINEEWVAKITDIVEETNVLPNYLCSGQLTKETNVYSFGVVLCWKSRWP